MAFFQLKMNPFDQDLVSRVQIVLDQILRSVPLVKKLNWQRELADDGRRIDWLVTVESQRRADPLAIEVSQKGHPRQIKEAINRLLLYRHHSSNPLTYLVVAAPFISEDGAALCRQERVGYCDLAGNCHLMFGDFFIERSGQRGSQRTTPQISNLFAAKSERVLRVLFYSSERAWKVAPLAKEAQVSLGTISSVRKMLLDREWAKDTDDGIRLTRPEQLLTEWAIIWGRRPQRPRKFYTRQKLSEIERRMANFSRERLVGFGLTGLAGAWRCSPMVQYIRTEVYWDDEADLLAQGVDLQPVATGANLYVYTPRDEGVFANLKLIDEVQVVSPLQLYLDLQNEPARGAEAAKHLWDTVLFPSHAAVP